MAINYVSFCSLPLTISLKAVLSFLLIITSCSISVSAQKLKEASGVIYHNDTLYIVGDDKRSNKAIFKHQLDYNSLISGEFPRPKDFTPDPINSSEAEDLEGIAFLNGRPVVLSEDNAKVFDARHTIVDYYNYNQGSAKETSNQRGMEGLVIKQINYSTSYVAALWEGGFVDGQRRPPFIMIHKIEHGSTSVFDASKNLTEENVFELNQDTLYKTLELNDSINGNKLALSASELLWHESGFIVLIVVRNEQYFGKKWLLKIDSFENTYKITDFCKLWADDKLGDKAGENWEGMTWIDEDQRKILLVADDGGKLPMEVIEIPEDW